MTIDPVWQDALAFAVKKNKGELKVSSMTNHVRKGSMNADTARGILDAMVCGGYLAEPEKVHQRYVWKVTDKGREAVQ